MLQARVRAPSDLYVRTVNCIFTSSGMMLCFGPAVDGSNRDNDRIERIIFPAYDGLPRVDDFRCEDDRVLRFMRIRAVSAHASNSDID